MGGRRTIVSGAQNDMDSRLRGNDIREAGIHNAHPADIWLIYSLDIFSAVLVR